METENKDITTFDQHLDKRYGKTGSEKRTVGKGKRCHLRERY